MTNKLNIILILILVACLLCNAAVRVARDVHSTASGLNNQRTLVRDSKDFLYCSYSGFDGAHYQVYIARSTNNGASWNPTWATITSGTTENLQPTMVVDSQDTLHLVWRGNLSSTSGNDADLLYTRYPDPSITTICTGSSYPGTHCPSLAVGPDDDLHVAYTGCPSSWRIRYMHMDRATYAWGPSEDVGTRTPSRWPSIEVDGDGVPHIIYRNTMGGKYRGVHRMKTATGWKGYNGEDLDTLDSFLTGTSSLEHTSIFIDNDENLHALWCWFSAFSGAIDTVRYKRYDDLSSSWGAIFPVHGNSDPGAVREPYNGDVVVDRLNDIFVLFHDNDSIFYRVSTDGGLSFGPDSVLFNDCDSKYPNALGSKYPYFNNPIDNCPEYVWTWADPDSPAVLLMFDRTCMEPEDDETTTVCASFDEPAESSFTSCEDQSITAYIGCCEGGDTIRVASDDTTTEYYDSTASSWLPAIEPDPSIWLSMTRISDATWIWSEEPASNYHGDWFRVLFETDCIFDTAFIRIQCDNKATIYANGAYVDTTHGNSGTGMAGWRTMYEFDLTPFLHGGVDTITLIGYNAGGWGGMVFEIIAPCSSPCCGMIQPSSIDFTVNGEHYSVVDPELDWDGDSTLTFTPVPPDTFENGDTITACVVAADDTCGGELDSVQCRSFFVDLAPPSIWNLDPPPGATVPDTFPDISADLLDSLTGLDTSTVDVTVSGTGETPYTLTWTGSEWHLEWNLASGFWWGDTVQVCVSATDTTDYCPDNILDTCWEFYIRPCVPLDLWIDCPLPCFSHSSCSSQAMVFGVRDTSGVTGIDADKMFFTVIENHSSGFADTSYLEPPSPYIIFDGDSLISIWGDWADRDSVIIILDSIFTDDGCRTEP